MSNLLRKYKRTRFGTKRHPHGQFFNRLAEASRATRGETRRMALASPGGDRAHIVRLVDAVFARMEALTEARGSL